jgi:hypothetical protein
MSIENDPINPDHYRSHPSGVECILISREFSFCLGNVIKYVWRAGVKTRDPLQDLRKARRYLDEEIVRLETLAQPAATEPRRPWTEGYVHGQKSVCGKFIWNTRFFRWLTPEEFSSIQGPPMPPPFVTDEGHFWDGEAWHIPPSHKGVPGERSACRAGGSERAEKNDPGLKKQFDNAPRATHDSPTNGGVQSPDSKLRLRRRCPECSIELTEGTPAGRCWDCQRER